MKLLFENWRRCLKESITEGGPQTRIVQTRKELIDLILMDPNQSISIDGPKGSTKKFGGDAAVELTFDYGEYPMLINPADGMGWDIILMPMNNSKDKSLFPVGHISYREDYPDRFGNDKIILAKHGKYEEESKTLLDSFFSKLKQFNKIEWY